MKIVQFNFPVWKKVDVHLKDVYLKVDNGLQMVYECHCVHSVHQQMLIGHFPEVQPTQHRQTAPAILLII